MAESIIEIDNRDYFYVIKVTNGVIGSPGLHT